MAEQTNTFVDALTYIQELTPTPYITREAIRREQDNTVQEGARTVITGRSVAVTGQWQANAINIPYTSVAGNLFQLREEYNRLKEAKVRYTQAMSEAATPTREVSTAEITLL